MLREVDDEGKRRRLPPWMLCAGASNTVAERYSSNDVCEKTDDGGAVASKSIATTSSPKRAVKTRRSSERKNLVEDSHAVLKPEKKRRKTIIDDDDDACDGCGAQKQQKVKNVAKRKQVVKSRKSNDPYVENCEVQTDEMDLTVEDCLAIAQEYVDANKDQEKHMDEKGGKDTQIPPTNSVSVESGTEFDTADTGNTLPTYRMDSPGNSFASLTPSVPSTNATGTTAQDMIDLLLGSWLKKPKEKEK